LSLDSTSGKPRQYCVQYNGYRWLCNCPHYLSNCEDVNFVCKHIVAVMQTIGQQTEVKRRVKRTNKKEDLKELEKLKKELEETEFKLTSSLILPESLEARYLYGKKIELEKRIKKLEERVEALEADVAYAINPANLS